MGIGIEHQSNPSLSPPVEGDDGGRDMEGGSGQEVEGERGEELIGTSPDFLSEQFPVEPLPSQSQPQPPQLQAPAQLAVDHHSFSPTRNRRSSSTDKGPGLAISPGKASPASSPTKGHGQGQGQGQSQGQHQDKSQGGTGAGAGTGANKGSKSVRMSAVPSPSNGTPKGTAGEKGKTPSQSSPKGLLYTHL